MGEFSAYWSGLEPEIKAVLITAVLSIVLEILRRIFASTAKIKWGVSHQHVYRLKISDEKTLTIRTREIWVQNVGRKKSENIEVAINYPPRLIETWPPLEREIISLPDGRPMFKFKKLGPKEFMTIHMFDDSGELPDILYIKHSDGNAKQVTIGPTQVLPKSVQYIVIFLLCLGAFSSVFWFIRLIQWIG